MASMQRIPEVVFDAELLKKWGATWRAPKRNPTKEEKKKPNCPAKIGDCFNKKQGMDFGKEVIDPVVAKSLAIMLGDIPVVKPTNSDALLPPTKHPNCVEMGDTKVVGGVRAQNFDIAYRPDGIRIAYDSKTLNDAGSVKKNWNNMINDLAAEATTLHTRFPYALALFFIVIPKPALHANQAQDIIRTLERMNCRESVLGENHKAESIAMVVWDPDTGEIDPTYPGKDSNLRLEKFAKRIEEVYLSRYKGLPPHER